ncbi:hypothetical protein ASE01_09060 [Nocardioides sp. Root190]|uniref:hypothetical protein n=1 Tax=Nocardioides sp. Root190 TaxID=1736488 RepID=UPI0006F9A071|nr:hypothetical protein [Nocardioides sp. Root190]KRB76908.1 hypothetical protein ASE01_09060 [Nocardioides sp. Root190]
MVTIAAEPETRTDPSPVHEATRRGGRQVPGTLWVFVLGCAIGAVASFHTVRTGTNLDYGDAMAHLTISRRILDGQTPGLQQLGTVWLPLPHLLLMPLVQNMFLFETGIAASILGTLCLGISAAALWRIMARLDLGTTARVVGLAVLLANPSLLYAYTTALTEPVLIAAILACIAGLAGWAFSGRKLSGGELAVFAGVPAACGVLTRYEGWALVVSGSVFVLFVVVRRGDGVRRALTLAASFASVPLAAIAWWLAYNTAWYGNPVEFLTGPYSAAAFTQVFIEQGQLTTKGNFGLSFKVLGWAIIESIGLIQVVAAGLGLAVLTWRRGIDDKALTIWLAGTSSAFLLFSLTTGQHIMVNDVSLPSGAYNNRYVLSAAPWAALLCAYLVQQLVSRSSFAAPRPRAVVAAVALTACAAGLIGQNLWWAGDPGERMTVIEEGKLGEQNFAEVKEMARWLHDNYDGGGLLMDESADKLAVAPVIAIDFDEVYNRAAGEAFEDALAAPQRSVRWVVMHRTQVTTYATKAALDLVTEALATDQQFLADYALVHSVADLGVYRRIGG